MLTITENGTVSERLQALIDHFSKGNKAAFGREADILPGVVASIAGGRKSKPSFELLQKLLTAYPTVSPDWLLFGSGGMLRGQSTPPGPAAPVTLPPAAHLGSGIRTRLRYDCELPEKEGQGKQTFSLEVIRYLPYRIKKKHSVLEEAEGGYIEVTETHLNTELSEHVVYLATYQADSEAHFNELRHKLLAKGWVNEGLIDTPEQYKLLSNGEPNPVYDPRFDGDFSAHPTTV